MKTLTIWKDADFWKTYLIEKIHKKIKAHNKDLDSSIDVKAKLNQLRTSIVCIFSEVTLYMSRLNAPRNDIENFIKEYTKMYNITDADSLDSIYIALKIKHG